MAKTKLKTRTRTITKSIRARAKGGFTAKNVQKLGIKAGIGVAAGLVTSFVMTRFAPDFADEGGIIVSSLAGGVPGTIAWTILGRRLTQAVGGFIGTPGLVGAGQGVGL